MEISIILILTIVIIQTSLMSLLLVRINGNKRTQTVDYTEEMKFFDKTVLKLLKFQFRNFLSQFSLEESQSEKFTTFQSNRLNSLRSDLGIKAGIITKVESNINEGLKESFYRVYKGEDYLTRYIDELYDVLVRSFDDLIATLTNEKRKESIENETPKDPKAIILDAIKIFNYQLTYECDPELLWTDFITSKEN